MKKADRVMLKQPQAGGLSGERFQSTTWQPTPYPYSSSNGVHHVLSPLAKSQQSSILSLLKSTVTPTAEFGQLQHCPSRLTGRCCQVGSCATTPGDLINRIMEK